MGRQSVSKSVQGVSGVSSRASSLCQHPGGATLRRVEGRVLGLGGAGVQADGRVNRIMRGEQWTQRDAGTGLCFVSAHFSKLTPLVQTDVRPTLCSPAATVMQRGKQMAKEKTRI